MDKNFIQEQLKHFREGDRETAFFALIEPPISIATLTEAFTAETDIKTRAFIVEVAWQQRKDNVIPLLANAIGDTEAPVWRQALDGLVTLASPAAISVLQNAQSRQFKNERETAEFRKWVAEALGQIREKD